MSQGVDQMTVKQIHIDIWLASGAGTKEAALNGYAYLEAGFLKGTILEGSGLTPAERTLLTALTFTGCPIAARAADAALNPWLKTEGAYAATRIVQAETFDLKSDIISHPVGDSIAMTLRAQVAGELPNLCSVAEPFQEAIRCQAPETLVGEFALRFRTPDASVAAVASTTYRLHGVEWAPQVWRNITIESSLPGGALVQVEQIDLFGSREEARYDLQAKLKACRH